MIVARFMATRSGWLAGIGISIVMAALLTVLVRSGMSLPVYLAASSIVLIDGFDIAIRLWLRHNALRREDLAEAPSGRLQPFAILLSVHNMECDVDALLDALHPYRSHVWIIDDASTDSTAIRLEAAGWRVLRAARNGKKPRAILQLLQQLPPDIRTLVVMDPDVRLPANLRQRILAFQQSGAAALCPKLTIRPDGALAELQFIEFVLSFDLGRQSLSPQSVTSGIAVYDRRKLADAMRHHSLSVYGEDLENAVVLLGQGEDIVYDPQLVVETDGKRSVQGWFSQRVGWSFSLFKIYAEHFGDIRRILPRSPMCLYQFGFYFIVLCMLLWPLKVVSIVLLSASAVNAVDDLLALDLVRNTVVNHPGFFAAAYVKYTLLALFAFSIVAPVRDLRRGILFMPVFFFYCVALVIPTTVGYLNWLTLRLFGRRLYADHYDTAPVLGRPRADV